MEKVGLIHIMLINAQLRAARAALRWSLDEASDASGVHRNTISKIEAGSKPNRSTVKALSSAFAEAGVNLTDRGIDLSRSFEEATC